MSQSKQNKLPQTVKPISNQSHSNWKTQFIQNAVGEHPLNWQHQPTVESTVERPSPELRFDLKTLEGRHCMGGKPLWTKQ